MSKNANNQSVVVNQLIAEYMRRTDAGEKLDTTQFIAAHPEHAEELNRHFENVNLLDGLKRTDTNEVDETLVKPAEDLDNSNDDPTAQTVVRGMADSETSVTRDHQRLNSGSTTNIEIPETFGRYAIQKVLGQGAMGAVYLAKDTQLDRDVALKIPKFGDGSGVDDKELLERFYREARASATIRSPNICPVYDVGEIEGQHYITMAYIEGRPLKDFTKSKKSHSEKQIITTIRKLAVGLEQAHAIGVIHRDLKPANIMVDKKGEPVVMDFGLARRSDSDDVQVTQSGAILGTPAYMAPEQVAGDQSAINHQVDIYALGIIMYELITGEMPFKGNLMALLQQISLNNPKKPSEFRKDLDPRLETICLKMMAGDQSKRYQSMNDVAADLQDVLRHPNRKQKKDATKNTGPKPNAIPTSHEESNPALVTVEHPKSYAEQLREKKSKTAKAAKKSNSPNKAGPRSKKKASENFGPPKKFLIAGGLGGLLLLLGIVFIVRVGKYDVQITLDDPEITLSVDDEVLNIKDGQDLYKLSAGEHKLKLQKEGLTAHIEEFTVTKDGETAIRAVVVNGKLDALLNGENASGNEHVEGHISADSVTATENSIPTKNSALEFDGDGDYISVNSVNIEQGKPFCIEFWIKLNDDLPEGASGTITSVGPYNNTAFRTYQDTNVFYSNFAFLEIEEETETSRAIEFSRVKLNSPSWTHIASQIDAQGRCVTYVNGRKTPPLSLSNVEFEQLVKLAQPIGFKKNLTIGANYHLGSFTKSGSKHPLSFFKGSMRAFRMTSGVKYTENFIPADEFKKETQTKVLYLFNKGSGTTLEDASGNGHDGKIIGAKWVALEMDSSQQRSFSLSTDLEILKSENMNWEFKDEVLKGHGTATKKTHKWVAAEFTNEIHGDYDIDFEFKQSAFYPIQVDFPLGDNQAIRVHIGGQGSALMKIDGKEDRDAAEEFRNDDAKLKYGKWQQLSGKIRHKGENVEIDVTLDGVHVGRFAGARSRISLPHWNTVRPTTVKFSGYGDLSKAQIEVRGEVRLQPSLNTTTDASSHSKAPSIALSPFNEAKAKAHQKAWSEHLGVPIERKVDLPGGEKITFVLIPPGEFEMGSHQHEQSMFLNAIRGEWNAERTPAEIPRHKVQISNPFYLSKQEVTQGEWLSVLEDNPSVYANSKEHPVNQVTWNEAKEFVNAMNSKADLQGLTIRLPTEAEWEYACKAGDPRSNYPPEELEEYAWFNLNSKGNLQKGGERTPNAFGLHDMLGNVWEWCADSYHPDFYRKSSRVDPVSLEAGEDRVLRGGAMTHGYIHCRPTYRNHDLPDKKSFHFGVRLAATISSSSLPLKKATPGLDISQSDGSSD
ncbi:bifunctional serine/threonine-protein kinase/formylglycine-generating enzyme family protein [Thalassoglobus polymorphus]|uniref:non-specific serine/threonine protein kinase n=1 Tax=Thalassoglobus polymorphus TaxID=2527994 RepID=A0A517QTQ5_9PLAN|nr:bifunctional serine/threonine-protein kinase/formylglycine-generating enzyme family protein [Thalassoglobus polymorphus]QDT35026.1 Serine/threonine-protein kinase PrkC [Thalassoglobus polymorphus]